ncbi:mannose-6-phosphate isomerase [Ceratobasidium sp. AG-Ba]|nr:mannose-6-phosphate isomerase [Ceratobasidium sp. AG-Ba]QRW01362.1 mannose-6-phosphate isomerase [Ceratobasidium sp. AG-Ba]
MTKTCPVFRLLAGANSYEWGKIGQTSKAGQYARADPEFKLQNDKPYSELWMGTHPTLPSKLQSGETLYDHLKLHPELIGDAVRKRFGDDLPFLFKVLAIEKALSIQAHPNKELAEKLHKERPDVIQPEMAIAITPFSGFCNFRPLNEIALYLTTVPEFASLISRSNPHAISSFTPESSDPKPALRTLFEALMTASDDQVKSALDTLINRYEGGGAKQEEAGVSELAQKLAKQYPGDVGVFCVFLLNVVELKEGEAMFLQADEPHAYISGDIIECMATSDNVVRAGLTPKLRDVPTLVSMLTYNSGPADAQRMKPQDFPSDSSSEPDSYTTLYDPPIPEFSVLLTDIPLSKSASHRPLDGPSIFIVTSGSGTLEFNSGSNKTEIKSEGEVWFVGAGTGVKFTAGSNGLVLYRAFVEAQ